MSLLLMRQVPASVDKPQRHLGLEARKMRTRHVYDVQEFMDASSLRHASPNSMKVSSNHICCCPENENCHISEASYEDESKTWKDWIEVFVPMGCRVGFSNPSRKMAEQLSDP